MTPATHKILGLALASILMLTLHACSDDSDFLTQEVKDGYIELIIDDPSVQPRDHHLETLDRLCIFQSNGMALSRELTVTKIADTNRAIYKGHLPKDARHVIYAKNFNYPDRYAYTFIDISTNQDYMLGELQASPDARFDARLCFRHMTTQFALHLKFYYLNEGTPKHLTLSSSDGSHVFTTIYFPDSSMKDRNRRDWKLEYDLDDVPERAEYIDIDLNLLPMTVSSGQLEAIVTTENPDGTTPRYHAFVEVGKKKIQAGRVFHAYGELFPIHE